MAVSLPVAREQLALDPAQHLFLAALILRLSRLMQQGIQVYGTIVERLTSGVIVLAAFIAGQPHY